MAVKICRDAAGGSLVALEGSFDLETAPEIRRVLLGLARKRKAAGLVLDLSAVSAIDTSGVAVLIELMRLLAQKGGRLQITGATDNVRRVIQLMRLDGTFDRAICGSTGTEG